VKESDLRRMIERATENGFGDWTNEWAIRIYILPLCAALITPIEWDEITKGGDGSTIMGTTHVNWLVNKLATRLTDLVKEMDIPKKWGEYYLTVSSHGLVYDDNGQIKTISFGFNVSHEGTYAIRERCWKPL
jgi:hypothetical protein